jgi:hypothetical protein
MQGAQFTSTVLRLSTVCRCMHHIHHRPWCSPPPWLPCTHTHCQGGQLSWWWPALACVHNRTASPAAAHNSTQLQVSQSPLHTKLHITWAHNTRRDTVLMRQRTTLLAHPAIWQGSPQHAPTCTIQWGHPPAADVALVAVAGSALPALLVAVGTSAPQHAAAPTATGAPCRLTFQADVSCWVRPQQAHSQYAGTCGMCHVHTCGTDTLNTALTLSRHPHSHRRLGPCQNTYNTLAQPLPCLHAADATRRPLSFLKQGCPESRFDPSSSSQTSQLA